MMQTSPKPSISPLERRQNDSMDVKSPPPSSGTHPVLDVINPDGIGEKAEAFDQIQSRKKRHQQPTFVYVRCQTRPAVRCSNHASSFCLSHTPTVRRASTYTPHTHSSLSAPLQLRSSLLTAPLSLHPWANRSGCKETTLLLLLLFLPSLFCYLYPPPNSLKVHRKSFCLSKHTHTL